MLARSKARSTRQGISQYACSLFVRTPKCEDPRRWRIQSHGRRPHETSSVTVLLGKVYFFEPSNQSHRHIPLARQAAHKRSAS